MKDLYMKPTRNSNPYHREKLQNKSNETKSNLIDINSYINKLIRCFAFRFY